MFKRNPLSTHPGAFLTLGILLINCYLLLGANPPEQSSHALVFYTYLYNFNFFFFFKSFHKIWNMLRFNVLLLFIFSKLNAAVYITIYIVKTCSFQHFKLKSIVLSFKLFGFLINEFLNGFLLVFYQNRG